MKAESRKTGIRLIAGGLLIVTAAAMVPQTAQASTASQLKKQANKIIQKQTKTSDSKKAKLKKLYSYVTYHKVDRKGEEKSNYGYKRDMTFAESSKKKNWAAAYALEMAKEKKGSCYHYAAFYGYLAKYATGYPVRVGAGTSTIYSDTGSAHAWTEVKIGKTWYVIDSNAGRYATKVKPSAVYLKKRSSVKKYYGGYKDAVYFTLK